ncbi:MAG TPA: class I SAM-dependent methyltransferase [Thermoanaerobaculia bacterium]|nr:class I SAM-dependent methyltransferase [Thermoanaerobaculia bacterium]
MPDDDSTRSWEAVAEDWVRHADENDYHNALLLPLTVGLAGDVRGLDVLDLGCGEGGYGRVLARRGGTVVGVDSSPSLVAVAQQRASEAGIAVQYFCANATALTPIASASFDVVVAAMLLMNVDDYPAAVAESWRVLRPGGRLVMSITHPCFSAPVSKWVDTEYFAVDRYFDRVMREDYITAQFRKPVLRRHRPLEDFMRPLLQRGFVLHSFDEPDGTKPDTQKTPRMARLQRIPYFLLMSWAKPR